MSTIDIDIFGPPTEEDEELHPDFAKVLLGFDPRHVEEFVTQSEERIAALERQLQDARTQLDAATRRLSTAREEAYGEVAAKMAELLRAADHYAEKLRRETEETCRRQLAETAQEADRIRHEAEAQAEGKHAAAEAELRDARIEGDRLLGELAQQRDVLVEVLTDMRVPMLQLVVDVDATTAVAQAPTAFALPPESEDPIPEGFDDLLGSLEGFELAPPPFGQGEHEQDEPPAAQAS